MKFKPLIAAVVVMFATLPVLARTKVQFDVTDGATNVVQSLSGLRTTVLKSCPGATVQMRVGGVAQTLYNAAGTSIGTSTTANTAARVSFYIDSGTYDVYMTGGGCSTHTWTGFSVGDGGVSVSLTGMGARCDGTTDDTVIAQAALDISGPHTVYWPAATCKITDTLTISQDSVIVQGSGQRASLVLFTPTAHDKPVFSLTAGASMIFYNQIRDLRIYSLDTTYRKIAIRLTDVSGTLIENVEVGPAELWTGGSASIGIQVRGRELVTIRKFTCYTDGHAIKVEQNPNHATLDFDVFHIEDLYTGIVNTNNYHILFDNGVNVTQWTMDGSNVFVLGGGGIYINDTSSGQFNYGVKISSLRWEQASVAGGYIVHWKVNTRQRSMRLADLITGDGTNQKGIFLQSTENVTIENFNYQGFGSTAAQAIETAGFNDHILLLNNFSTSTSYKTMTGMTQIFEAGRNNSSVSAFSAIEYWTSTASNAARDFSYVLYGVKSFRKTGSLADAANVTIIDMGTIGVTHAFVRVAASGATKFESGSVSAHSTVTVTSMGGSTNFQTTTGAGKLSVSMSGSNLVLTNNLGETVTYDLTLEWR